MALAPGGHVLASGSGDFDEESPPAKYLNKPCDERVPFTRPLPLHKWSWTKRQQGARVEMENGFWNHHYLAYMLSRHKLVKKVEPRRNKLTNTKATDHESDTNYLCDLQLPSFRGYTQPFRANFGPYPPS